MAADRNIVKPTLQTAYPKTQALEPPEARRQDGGRSGKTGAGDEGGGGGGKGQQPRGEKPAKQDSTRKTHARKKPPEPEAETPDPKTPQTPGVPKSQNRQTDRQTDRQTNKRTQCRRVATMYNPQVLLGKFTLYGVCDLSD